MSNIISLRIYKESLRRTLVAGFQIEFQVNRSLVLKLTKLTSHFVLNLKKF